MKVAEICSRIVVVAEELSALAQAFRVEQRREAQRRR